MSILRQVYICSGCGFKYYPEKSGDRPPRTCPSCKASSWRVAVEVD